MDEKNTQAKKYERSKIILSIVQTTLSLLLIILIIFGGYSVEIRDYVDGQSANPYIQLSLFVIILSLIFTIIDFPLSFIKEFWLEHRYQLSNQTAAAWLWEQIKALLVGVVIFVPLLLIFYYLLRNAPHTWWLWTAAVLFLFSIVLGRIAPQVIFPLFYKFEPLQDEQLTKRMQRLAEAGKFRLQGVYKFNMSKDTKKANAAFTGMGKSRRIILGDTLLDNLTVDEIEAVFAHEVGHYVHKHLHWGIISGALNIFVMLFLGDRIYSWALHGLQLRGPADLAALPLLALILSVLGFVAAPLSNMLSRRFERQADAYAVQVSSRPEAFIEALKKLSVLNLTDTRPHPLIEFLFHSHPAVSKRIQMIESLLHRQSPAVKTL